ncbi:hypothetical protein KCU83_g8639, partial [Aureobasidium melanogenum]
MDPSLNFRIIDYICRTDPKDASRMDQNLVDELSDTAALNTISTNIQCLPSLNRKRTCKLSDDETESRGNWIKKSNSAKGPAIGDATARFLDDFCTNHPWPKGMRNEQWLKQATASRASLNRFWRAFRSQWAKKLGENGVWSSSIDEDLSMMRAHESEEYRAEVAAEKDDDEERCEGVRTIVVHRPHPSPTINPIMLHSIAKRMTKWSDWKRELFIERGKEKKEGDVHGSEV